MVMPIDDKEYIAELEEERNGWRRDTIALREENARLRSIIKGVHGALTDASTVVVPGSLDADLYAPVMRLVAERDALSRDYIRLDARADRLRDEANLLCVAELEALRRAEKAEAEVERLRGLIVEAAEDQHAMNTGINSIGELVDEARQILSLAPEVK